MEHIMNFKKSAIALSLIASAASMSVYAQDNVQPLTRAQVTADLQAYQQSGLDALNFSEQGADTNSPEYKAALARYTQLTGKTDAVAQKSLTREQVKADLAAWKKAGLADLNTGEQSADTNSAQYRAAVAVYEKSGAALHQASLTRQQVQADLKAWNDSGLSALNNGDHGADTNSAEYKAAVARYEQLRGQQS
jgi:hypothetical protein